MWFGVVWRWFGGGLGLTWQVVWGVFGWFGVFPRTHENTYVKK